MAEIGAGLWGYNTLLTMGALGCVFYPFTPHSFILSLIGVLSSIGVQVFLRIVLVQQVSKYH